LSRTTADAAIDTFNVFAQFQWRVTPDLRLDFEVRDRDEDNKTNYLALNPLTGQYGYIGTDGGLAARPTAGTTAFTSLRPPAASCRSAISRLPATISI
jgi:hypothetical protein